MTQIKVGDYLFKRLHELGIRSVFGVPGGKFSSLKPAAWTH
jgi:TPP-dependent 2-oxoacid decarboxylase